MPSPFLALARPISYRPASTVWQGSPSGIWALLLSQPHTGQVSPCPARRAAKQFVHSLVSIAFSPLSSQVGLHGLLPEGPIYG